VSAEKTVEKVRGKPFQAGDDWNGNATGRPKGSRNKLGEQFLADMLADWDKNGIAAIKTMREERPHEYVKVVASILPRELNVKVSDLDELSDAELNRRINALATALEIGIGEAAGGEEAPQGPPSLN